jgi:hypothetical protein
MNRIQLACYSLIASAFVLAALLMVQTQHRQIAIEQQADASMVINRDTFTIMTAITKDNEEALFVLDNQSQRLMVFKLDLEKSAVRLLKDGVVNLNTIFNGTEKADTGKAAPGRVAR